MKKFFLLAYITFISSPFTRAETNLTIKETAPQRAETELAAIADYLATWKKAYQVQNQKDQLKVMEKARSFTPVVERLEFRVDSDEIGLPGQSYSMRMVFNGIGERKYSKKVYLTDLKLNTVEQEINISRSLRRRYDQVIEYYYRAGVLDLNNQLRLVYEDKVKVLRKSLSVSKVSVNDILTAENDYTAIQLDIMDMETSLSNCAFDIGGKLGILSFPGFDLTNFVAIDDIFSNIQYDLNPGDDNVYIKAGKLQQKLAKHRYKLEKAEIKRYFTFMEANLDTGDLYYAPYAMSLEAGFSVPIAGSRRGQVGQRQLRAVREKNRMDKLSKDLTYEIKETYQDLVKYRKQYEVIEKTKDRGNAASSYNVITRIKGSDPMTMLNIKENILKLDIMQLKIERDIFESYIKLLDQTGYLAVQPYKNYLSVMLEEIPQK